MRRFPLRAHDVADRFHDPLAAFVDMLNAMRFGQLDARTTVAFHKLEREVTYEDEIDPTELCVLAYFACLSVY